MKRVIICLAIAISSICASAQEHKYTLMPAFCSLGDTIYAPLDTVMFAFDQEVIDAYNGGLANITVYVKSSTVTKDGVETNAGDIVKCWNKYGKGYVLIKYDAESSSILPKGDYQLHLTKGVIDAKKELFVTNNEFHLNFTVPDDLGYGRATFSGDTIASAHYTSFLLNFPTDIKAIGSDCFLILSQEWKEPIEIPFEIRDHYLYAYLTEEMYFDEGVKYTLTLPAGSVSAKYRDDIVNLETKVEFIGGNKSGVEEVEAGAVSVASANGRLTVTGISAGTRIAVFSDDGKMVGSMVAGGASATMELPGKGVYIVTVDGRPYKLINRP